MNEHAIKLINGKQPPYGPIYICSLVGLGTLKTYIKAHLKTWFMRSFKSSANASILFNKKLNGNLHLCVDYQGLNNLMIKHQYSLPLIGESLARFSQTK